MSDHEEDSFESRESAVQVLTFGYLKSLEERKNCKLDCRSCPLYTAEGKYNNLALMLSDQCPWTCEIRYEGSTHSLVKGSLLKQLDMSFKTVLAIHRDASSENGKNNKVPMALSEIILNAASHRRYDCDFPTVINVDQDWLEVMSPGVPVRTGMSFRDRTRNPVLADAFDQMGFKNPSIQGMDGVIKTYRSC